jgi:hypothetical protein
MLWFLFRSADELATQFVDVRASNEGHGPFHLGTEVGEHLIDTCLTSGTETIQKICGSGSSVFALVSQQKPSRHHVS